MISSSLSISSEDDSSYPLRSKYIPKSVSTPPRRRQKSASQTISLLSCSPSCFIAESSKPVRPDLVQKHRQMRDQWSRYSLLVNDSREGRKFNLADHMHVYAQTFTPQRKGIKFAYNSYVPPNEKRRDRLRFMVRMKLMKGKTEIASPSSRR